MDEHYLFGLQVPSRPRFKTRPWSTLIPGFIYEYQASPDLAQIPGLREGNANKQGNFLG